MGSESVRLYGEFPFGTAVLHGGPGAAGEMAPVARELALHRGVLEPMQTRDSIDGQIGELEIILSSFGALPVTLIGYSWGAWLAYLFAARFPEMVKKLILVSSGPFEERYAETILPTRLSRLTEKDREEAEFLLAHASLDLSSELFAHFGALFSKADAFDPILEPPEPIVSRPDIFHAVWNEASKLRKCGLLLESGRTIKCPVVAIHGDHDPHPAEGVRVPLARILGDFRFILLEKCGTRPGGNDRLGMRISRSWIRNWGENVVGNGFKPFLEDYPASKAIIQLGNKGGIREFTRSGIPA